MDTYCQWLQCQVSSFLRRTSHDRVPDEAAFKAKMKVLSHGQCWSSCRPQFPKGDEKIQRDILAWNTFFHCLRPEQHGPNPESSPCDPVILRVDRTHMQEFPAMLTSVTEGRRQSHTRNGVHDSGRVEIQGIDGNC